MADVVIKVRENGPYLIKGPIELIDADGNPFRMQGENIVLCRCGQSENKPFCDGTHRLTGFEATGRAPINQDPLSEAG
jgi:CDGSH-type Zn-finger protein